MRHLIAGLLYSLGLALAFVDILIYCVSEHELMQYLWDVWYLHVPAAGSVLIAVYLHNVYPMRRLKPKRRIKLPDDW